MGNTESLAQKISETFSFDDSDDDDASPRRNFGAPKGPAFTLAHLDVDKYILRDIKSSTQELPWTVDTQGQLMLFLDLQSLGRSLQVCRSWYLCIHQENYWKRGILFVSLALKSRSSEA